MPFLVIALLLSQPLEPGQLELSKLAYTVRDWKTGSQGHASFSPVFEGDPSTSKCLPVEGWFTLGFGRKVRVEGLTWYPGSVGTPDSVNARPAKVIIAVDGARQAMWSLEDPLGDVGDAGAVMGFEKQRRLSPHELSMPAELKLGDAGVVTEFLNFQLAAVYPGTADACFGKIVPKIFEVPASTEPVLRYDGADFKKVCPKCTTRLGDRMETAQGQSQLSERGRLHWVDKPFDGDLATAWCEDGEGDGISHKFGFELKEDVRLEGFYLHGGYFKTEAILKLNHRLKRARVRLNGKQEFDFALEDPAARSFDEVKKKPVFVRLPPELRTIPVRRMSLMILEVYKGTRHTDTCVSEVKPIIEPLPAAP